MCMSEDRPIKWALLLGKWTAVARASAALPDSAHGRRWRAAVPSVIALQAVAMALVEVAQHAREGRIDGAELAVARDRAAVMIRQHERTIRALWEGEAGGLPGGLVELLADVHAALEGVSGPGFGPGAGST